MWHRFYCRERRKMRTSFLVWTRRLRFARGRKKREDSRWGGRRGVLWIPYAGVAPARRAARFSLSRAAHAPLPASRAPRNFFGARPSSPARARGVQGVVAANNCRKRASFRPRPLQSLLVNLHPSAAHLPSSSSILQFGSISSPIL
jgi:hypothetical protein